MTIVKESADDSKRDQPVKPTPQAVRQTPPALALMSPAHASPRPARPAAAHTIE